MPRSRKRVIQIVTGSASCSLQKYTFCFNPNAVTHGANWLGGFALWGDANPAELEEKLYGKRPAGTQMRKTFQVAQVLRGDTYHLDIGLSWRTAAVMVDRIKRV